jgi:hypothetical protein
MDAVTENLLRELETSPTDLKKLVISTLWRNCVSVAVQADAVARWERDDPRRWASVQNWLLGQGITLTVLRNLATASGSPPPPSAEPQPPPTGLQA